MCAPLDNSLKLSGELRRDGTEHYSAHIIDMYVIMDMLATGGI